MVEALSQPLLDDVKPYLQVLFGESKDLLRWKEEKSQLESFSVQRSLDQSAFHELSHRAKEQVALALRLAKAEILADRHDRCLPLVLADAFPHSDLERTEKLKTILFMASERKLQMILYCHSESYETIVGSEVAFS